MSILTILLLPAIGALIGWLTNRLAIQMLFRPRSAKSLFGIKIQGLIPKRQKEVAQKVGEIVERDLFQKHIIIEQIGAIDLSRHIDELATKLVWERIAPKIREIPLLGSFVNDKILFSLQRMALEALSAETGPLLEKVASEAEKHIAVSKIIEEKMNGFDLDELERIVRSLAKKEFAAIEWLGAIVGFFVGLIQVMILFIPELLVLLNQSIG